MLKCKKLFYLSLSLMFITLPACTSSQENISNEQIQLKNNSDYKLLAKNKYVDGYIFEFNSNKSYLLCVKKEKLNSESPFGPFSYFIFDLTKKSLEFEDNINNGTITWLNDQQLKISLIPGIVKGDEQVETNILGYIYDLTLNKKIPIQNDRNN